MTFSRSSLESASPSCTVLVVVNAAEQEIDVPFPHQAWSDFDPNQAGER